MFTRETLLHNLHTHILGKKIFVFDTIDSTNTCAKVLAEINIENGTIVIAEYQTEGRGRLGRSWISDHGKNLLFSIVIKPPIHRSRVGFLPLYTAVSVAQALESYLNIHVECKWPNDILINNKKCCGILLESSFQTDILRYAILGIGINVNQDRFNEELFETATSLKRELNTSIDRVALFQHIVCYLDGNYILLENNDFATIVERWIKRAPMMGNEVTIIHGNEQTTGIAEGIDSQGGLIVRCQDGVKIFYAGDVSIRSSKR
ncbi:MAG: biotin--[acetyl-CoA-carboxylase] ligase [Bacteroidetes bacterium]|nr:biotin--[acetyl-CoA-carboxylase] ligase [Bacteroidota bacterium]